MRYFCIDIEGYMNDTCANLYLPNPFPNYKQDNPSRINSLSKAQDKRTSTSYVLFTQYKLLKYTPFCKLTQSNKTKHMFDNTRLIQYNIYFTNCSITIKIIMSNCYINYSLQCRVYNVTKKAFMLWW